LYDFFVIETKFVAFSLFSYLAQWTLCLGGLCFRAIEDWPFEQTYFFTAMTLLTVGYGNIVPKTTGGRVFLFFYFAVGIGILSLFLLAIQDLVIEKAEEDVHRLVGVKGIYIWHSCSCD
jgi:voltage-gated potassium channel